MQLVIEIVGVCLNYVMQFFIWKTVMADQRLFFQDESNMAMYYYAISLLSIVYKCNAADIGEAFKQGRLDKELIRPIQLFDLKIIENLYSNISVLLLAFPLLSAIFFLSVNRNLTTISAKDGIVFLVCIIMGYLICFCIDFIVGTVALIIDEIWAIRGVISFCIRMISGFFVPLALFPDWFLRVIEYTPFYYIYYFPTIVLTKTVSIDCLGEKVFFLLFWTVFLFIMAKWIYKKLIKLYTAYGG